MRFRSAFAALLLFVSSLAAAQEFNPNNERGFDPQKAYAFEEIGAINLFNGNLNLPIPIGQAFPVSQTLSYQLALHYGGNNWAGSSNDEFESEDGKKIIQCDESGCHYIIIGVAWSYPSPRDNAGFGWRLSLGRLDPDLDAIPVGATHVYEGPDGSTHGLYTTLHAGQASEAHPDVFYSRDGSYLRLRKEAGKWKLDFPDGSIHTFDTVGPSPTDPSAGMVNRMEDRHGNSVTIDYHFTGAPAPAGNFTPSRVWKISDSTGRAHYVYLRSTPSFHEDTYTTLVPHEAVAEIQLQAIGGAKAIWSLQYENESAADPWSVLTRKCTMGMLPETMTATVKTAVLEQLKLPDGTKWTFAYDHTGTVDCESAGALTSAKPPGGGEIVWEYQRHWYPTNSHLPRNHKNPSMPITSIAVKKRTSKGIAGTVLGTRTYEYYSDPFIDLPGFPSPKEKNVVVTDYEGDTTTILRRSKHFFSVCPRNCVLPAKQGEYGLPLTPNQTNSNSNGAGRQLSSITYGGPPQFQTELTRTYVTYEADVLLENADLGVTDTNRRMSGQTTVDEAGNCLEERMLLFDGLGHHRQKTQSGTCGGSAERTATTAYNQANTDVGGDVPLWWTESRIPNETESWILNRYTSQSSSEGSSSDLALFDTDPAGLLRRKRVLVTSAVSAHDLVTRYSYDHGNVIREESFGGANQNLETTALATMALPDAEYRIDHTHDSGVVRTSKPHTLDFFSLDRDVDPTGLTLTARDTVPAVTTSFAWDTSGRLKRLMPGHGRAWTHYNWQPADRMITVSAYPPTHTEDPNLSDSNPDVLSRSIYQYDTLGRLTDEIQLQPDRTRARRKTAYNALGWKTSVTEWHRDVTPPPTPAPPSTTFVYDALGRTTQVTMPDAKFVTTAYTGSRIISRTIAINAEATDVTTKETYDAFGRLIEVEEPKETEQQSAGPKTTYEYDVHDKLTRVTQGAQTRTFVYDRAGRLISEDHPESDPVTYTYDSQGRVVTRQVGSLISLKFHYDKAGRLLTVHDERLNRDLKVLDYDEATITTPTTSITVTQPGRLIQQTRNNYYANVSAPTAVTDSFEYDLAGRVSRKHTSVAGKYFSQDFEYTLLSSPLKLNFPICPTCSGTANQARGIGLSYGAGGALTGISGVTGTVSAASPGVGITYQPSGQVHQVRHAAVTGAGQVVDGVLDTYVPDVMPRPKSISFTGAADCDLITAPSSSEQNIGSGQQAQFTVTSPAGDAVFAWYRGVAGDFGNPVATGIVNEAAPGGGRKSTLTTPQLTETTPYWCRVTRPNATCSENSTTFIAHVCQSVVIDHPVTNYAGDAIPVPLNVPVEASVTAHASSLKYDWRLVNVIRSGEGWLANGEIGSIGGTASILWNPSQTGTFGLQVTVTSFCDNSAETRLVKVVKVQSAVSCPLPVVATGFPEQMHARNGQTEIRLALTLEPPMLGPDECALLINPPPAWPDNPANLATGYYFRWSVDGETRLSGPGQWEFTLDVPSGAAVEVEVWRLCKDCNGTVLAASPHIVRRVFIFNIDNCPPPPLTLDQTVITLPVPGAKFTAGSTWPSVTYQWYKGDSGNTRDAISGETENSYTPLPAPGTYWVRASSGCDTHTDSPTLVVKSASCTPVRFLRQPQSRDIAAGTSHILDFETSGSPPATDFAWYREGSSQPVSTSRTYTVAPIRTTSYRAQVTGCTTASSALATLHVVSCADIQVSQVPADRDIYVNNTTTLSFGASSAHQLLYQWYQGETGDTSTAAVTVDNLPSTTASINVRPLTTTKYWVRVSIAGGCAIDSRTITVQVCAPPTLHGFSPFGYLTRTSAWAMLYVLTTGEKLAYQWYAGETGDTTNPLDGKIASFIWVTPDTTSKYWCRITSGRTSLNCYVDTGTITVFVCSTPAITTQPQSARIFSGSRATLTVAANAGSNTEPLTYQWKQENASGQWVNVTGEPSATTATFQTPPLTSPQRYLVEVSAGRCSIDSEPVEVSICTFPAAIDPATAERQIGYNESVTLVLPVMSPVVAKNVVWYQGAVGVKDTPVRSGVNVSFTTPPLTATTVYWAEFEYEGCSTRTGAYTVRVCKPTITTEPANIVLRPTESTTLSVVAANIPGLTYQWYIGPAGTTTNPIPSGTSATLPVTPTATTTYWVRISGSCGLSADSVAATVTVCAAPGISLITPSPQAIRSGQSIQLQTRGSGNNLSYQWYIGTSGTTTTPAGTNSDWLTVSPTTTTSYWCKITSDGLCTTNGPTITVDVCTDPTITTQPASRRIFSGSSTTLSVAASSTRPLTYQWYIGAAGVTTNPINGATASSVTVSPTTATDYWVRITTGACTVDSTAATVSMCTFNEVVNGTSYSIGSGESVTLALPTMSPVVSKNVTWYRGAVGDRTTPVATGVNITYGTPALTVTTSYWAEFEYQGCVSRTNVYTVSVCKPAITTQPVGAVIQSGQSRTLTVAVTSIPGQTFQWYIGPVGTTTTPAPNGNTTSLTVAPAATTTYWMRVTGPCGVNADSSAATITVCAAPGISLITPSPQSIRSGQSIQLQTRGSGSNLSYQWYIGTTGTTTNPTGTNSDWLTVSPTTTTSYWCKITSDGLCTTNGTTITVNVCTDPAVNTQPASQRIFSGKPTPLSVTASSPGTLSYQWYTGASGVTTNPIGGATASSVTVSPTAATDYWVRITTGACTVNSSTASLSMCAFNEVYNGTTHNIAWNGSVTLSLPTMSPVVSKNVTWYRGAVGDRTVPVRSGVNVTYTTPALTATTLYWAEFEYEGCVSRTNAYTVNVCNPVIATQPQSVTVNNGQQVQLTVTANGSPLTYQWYRGASGNTSDPVAGQTTSTLTIASATTTQSYWVRVTGCSASADSVAATVTICTSPTVNSVTKEPWSTYNGTGTLTASATGTSLTYQWYKGQSGVTTNPISGATASTYSFILQNSEYYWVRVTSGCNGVSADSAAIMYSVDPRFQTHPQNASIPSNTRANLSVSALGTYLGYQWFKNNNPISGATQATYQTELLTAQTTYYCKVTSGTTGIAFSNQAVVSICSGPRITNFSSTKLSGNSWRLTISVFSDDLEIGVKYHWYSGVPGDVSQSIDLGEASSYRTFYPTATTTYWARVWWYDDTCYADTAGRTLTPQ